MVVSYSAAWRENALSALPITNGARLIDSTPRPQQVRLARLDGARRRATASMPEAAQAVDGGAAHFGRQAGQQRRHARHVAVVFAGLVGAAKITSCSAPSRAWMARHQRGDWHGAQVVGAHLAQGRP